MWTRKHSVTLSLIFTIIITVLVTATSFFGPLGMRLWFCSYRGWNVNQWVSLGTSVGAVASANLHGIPVPPYNVEINTQISL